MKLQLFTSALLFLTAFHARSIDSKLVLDAAVAADSTVKWQVKSILFGDFTCQGKQEFAILGTKPEQIFIVVFRPPIMKPVDILQYSGVARNPDTATLSTESLDYDIKELERDIGFAPDGLESSKTCQGLNMTDQMTDSAHIYWHRKNQRFESWSL